MTWRWKQRTVDLWNVTKLPWNEEWVREIGKWNMGTKKRIGNEVTDRAGVQVRLFPIFHFPVRCSPFPVPRSSFLVPPFSSILFVSSRRRVAWRAERLFVFASHANRRKQLKFSNCHIAGFKYCVVATIIQRPSKRPLILYKRVDWMYQIS